MTLAETVVKHPPNKDLSVIRIATAEEEDDIFRICKMLHEENGYYFSFSADKVRANLQRAFRKDRAMIPVIGPPGRIEAIGYVSIEQFAWSDDWHLSEWFNYVLPPYRNSQHAKALLIWEKGAADRMGIVLYIGVVTNARLAAKLRLYRRIFGANTIKVNGRPFDSLYDATGKRIKFDLDDFLTNCGVAGAYFVYKPPKLYSDRVAAEGSPH
jgi:hypothetical protein